MRTHTKICIAATAAALLILAPTPWPSPDLGVVEGNAAGREWPLQGFGAGTIGGAGGQQYTVTSLGDSGPGTLRDAVSSSNRLIRFSVGGTIRLESSLVIQTHHLTIDAADAPSGGITITAAHGGVSSALLNIKNAHDIIVRHIRVRDAPDPGSGDNLRIWSNSYNIVIDHCSFRRGGDGNLDISDGAHDVTVQWCIIADTVKNSLVRTGLYNISFHHNLYVEGDERNPQLDDAHGVDMVNNVIYGWAGNYGTRIRNGSSANLVANYYVPGPGSDQSDALQIAGDAGPVYMEGNVIPPACQVSGTTGSRLPAPNVGEMTAEEALYAVLNDAGAHPRDSDDDGYTSIVAASPVESTSWGSIKGRYR